ncbi:MAG: hypothetical protein IPO59_15070 [Betaproteobacteria bacterium]|nr:hypothetical protein [Betaproteobacteria bacterium]
MVVLGKAVLVAALLAPAIAMGAGAGAVAAAGKGFKAGKYYNPTATIATLSRTELKHATKVENIDGMLALLSVERRGNLDETFKLQAWERYNAIPDGDLLLLRCLKDPKCEPLACADIARLSDLHREVLLRQPARNLTQANQAIGDIGEQVMIRHFESTGWTRIEGQVGRSGIDGLFVKRNADGVVREVLAVESKYNTSALKPTNHGQQMSREWVEMKLQNLLKRQPDEATYRQVEKLVNGGYYRARLWTIRVDKGEIQIDLQRVRSASDKVDELIDDPGTRVSAPPEVILISAPRNSFEKTIVDAYQQALRGLGPRP